MDYKIGQLIEEYAKQQDTALRRDAIDCGLSEVEFCDIRKGRRTASANKLQNVIPIEKLKQPLLDEIKPMLDDLDTDIIIEVYNIIYNKLELGKYAFSKD